MLRGETSRDLVISFGCRLLSLPFRTARQRKHTLARPSRVVVIKTGSLGDVLMATAAVRELRQALDKAHLAFAVGAWSSPMVTGNPNLNQVIDLGPLGGRQYPVADYLAAVLGLRRGRFDAAIVLDRAPLVTLLPFLAGIPFRVGLDSAGRGFSLTIGVPCPPRRHEVDLYLDVVRAAGYPVCDPRLEFFPSQDDVTNAKSILSAGLAELGKPEEAPVVAIHPGGGVNPGMSFLAKRWSPTRFATIADQVAEELGATVLLVGGPDDQEVVSELLKSMHRPAINLSGRLTWGQLGAVLQRCRLLIANDTGAAHLAAAVGTPPVVIFGPTDPQQYGPYGALGRAVSLDLPCAPCFQGGRFPPCHSAHRCLANLDVSVVWAAIRDQWHKRKQDMEQASAAS